MCALQSSLELFSSDERKERGNKTKLLIVLVGKNKRQHKINQDNHILYSKLLKAFSLIVYRRVFFPSCISIKDVL